MTELICIGALLTLCLIQQFHIHTLINKIMSRNFYDYEMTKNMRESKKQSPQVHRSEDDDYLDEASGVLGGFN